MALIAAGRYAEAAELIRCRNPLPVICGRVCYHPCEADCNRGFVDEPVAIQHLKRFALDWQESPRWRPTPTGPTPSAGRRRSRSSEAAPRAWPAPTTWPRGATAPRSSSATACRRDAGRGHPQLPPAAGAPANETSTSSAAGRGDPDPHEPWAGTSRSDQLRKQGYAAFFLATGAHRGVPLEIPGEDLEGVVQGVDFLRRHALGIPQTIGPERRRRGRRQHRRGRRADRAAPGRGAGDDPLPPDPGGDARRGARDRDAEAEGVRFAYLTAPLEVLEERGRVRGLRCVRDAARGARRRGPPRPVPVPGSEHTLAFDTVIVAIGQSPSWSSSAPGTGRPRAHASPRGTLEVNAETLRDRGPGVFAGGDVVLGPATVIAPWARGSARPRRSTSICAARPLQDFEHPHGARSQVLRGETLRPHLYSPPYTQIAKQAAQARCPSWRRRASARALRRGRAGLHRGGGRSEARRCLHCGVCVECCQCVKACQPGPSTTR